MYQKHWTSSGERAEKCRRTEIRIQSFTAVIISKIISPSSRNIFSWSDVLIHNQLTSFTHLTSLYVTGLLEFHGIFFWTMKKNNGANMLPFDFPVNFVSGGFYFRQNAASIFIERPWMDIKAELTSVV